METIRGIFHRPTPQEQALLICKIDADGQLTKWKATIRREERLLDRQITSLKEQEDKSKRMVQQLAKKRPQDVGSARILAKELVRAKKQRQRMYQSKATLNSIQMQLQEQIATYKISGILKQSTGVMRDVNSLVKIPELNRDMRQFSMELTKAGIIGEMMDDTMEMLDDPELEDEADAEVDAILTEITGGILGKAGKAPEVKLPNETVAEEEDQSNLEEMRGRLEALKS